MARNAEEERVSSWGVKDRVRDKALHFVAYGIFGWCAEVVWTGLRSGIRGDRTLASRTYLWMFPIYGLAAVFFEPLHDAVRSLPALRRAAIYAAGIMATEYLSGWTLERTLGKCPWDYRGKTRLHLRGYVRLDYAPAWALAGLVLERLHDLLDGRPSQFRSGRTPVNAARPSR